LKIDLQTIKGSTLMKRIGKILTLGILTGLLSMMAQSSVTVVSNIYSTGVPFSVLTLPFYSQIWIYGMLLSSFSFLIPSILGAGLLTALARYAQFKWMGLAAGVITGMLVDIPYFLLSITIYGGIKFPLDDIFLGIPIMVFGIAGTYVFAKRGWKKDPVPNDMGFPKPSASETPHSRPISPVPPPAVGHNKRKKIKIKLHRFLALAILIPPFLGICLCVLSVGVYASTHLTPYTLADQLWSYRIEQKLKEKGFSAEELSITRDQTDNLFSQMDIQVGIEKSKDYLEYQDVVETVHKSIFEALDSPVLPPAGLGKINVFINDDRVGFYRISIDYETARQYQQGKIKRDDYIQHWRFNPE